ncbi:MAG: hypothetical protein ACQETB_05265 [Halobacteriota archaeon]
MTDRDRPTMKDVRHTHPYTGETFGAVYRRGPVLADGGRTVPINAGSPTVDENGARDRMGDVDHTGPDGETANGVWSRGGDADTSATEVSER